jgi:AcrR family transcriptional regulator
VGVAERREREREQLRQHVIEAARDLLLEQGLSGLSMRSIAERIEYSPATIYLYFEDKEELVREVVRTGFERMSAVVMEEMGACAGSGAAEQYGAMGRAYAKFALGNPSYFRVMFELPGKPEVECVPQEGGAVGFEAAESLVRRAVEEGGFGAVDPRRTAVVGWGLIHGLTSLYLSGHLGGEVAGPEEFLELIEDAMHTMYAGWAPATPGGEGR